jgi:hypothetical protein
LDHKANCYAFNAAGLMWQYTPEGNYWVTENTFPQALANGNIYYSLTDRSFGYIQALTAGGQPLWLAKSEAFSFYQQPLISPSGHLLMVDNDLIDGLTGERIPYTLPVEMADRRIDRFLMGLDGNTYFLAGSSLNQWRVKEGVLEVVRTVAWTYPAASQVGYSPFVMEDGSVMVLVFAEPSNAVIWLDAQGGTVGGGGFPSDYWIVDYDTQQKVLYVCGKNAQTAAFGCLGLSPASATPVWDITLADFQSFRSLLLHSESSRLFVISGDNTLYVVDVSK